MDQKASEPIEKFFKSSINPLQFYIRLAQVNHHLGKEALKGKGTFEIKNDWLCPEFPASGQKRKYDSKGRECFHSREDAGVGSLYNYLNNDTPYKVIFCNDLSMQIWGFDALALDENTGTYLICEAKGTTGKFKTPPSYLKKTVKKGRQLSWEWCWRTLTDFAEDSLTAPVFTALYRPLILQQNIERLLFVAQLERSKGDFVISDTKFWDEEHLQQYDFLSKRKDLSKHRRWLTAIDKSDGKI